MVVSEIFTEFYTNSSHVASVRYLYFGLHGHNALVPWIWSSVGMAVLAALMLLCPNVYDHIAMLVIAFIWAIFSFWIEKGMGLIIPAFVPSTLHEIVKYVPSIAEWKIMAGIWAFGLMCFTVALKIATPIFTGRVSVHHDDHFSLENPPINAQPDTDTDKAAH